jgi:hypothetical protein
MEIAGVVERVEHISAVRANPAADAALIKSGLVAVREAKAWMDAQPRTTHPALLLGEDSLDE